MIQYIEYDGVMEWNLGLIAILLVSRTKVMINRDSWGHSYLEAKKLTGRGEHYRDNIQAR